MRLDDAVSNVRFREASETASAAETKAHSGHSLALTGSEPATRSAFVGHETANALRGNANF